MLEKERSIELEEMKMKITSIVASVVLLASSSLNAASNRDYIEIVGSSTVYPFAIAVAERFGKRSKFKTPKIESADTSAHCLLYVTIRKSYLMIV